MLYYIYSANDKNNKYSVYTRSGKNISWDIIMQIIPYMTTQIENKDA